MRINVLGFGMMLVTAQLFAFSISRGQSIKDTRVVFEAQHENLKKTITRLGEQTGLRFFYPSEKVASYQDITVRAADRSVAEVLDIVLKNTSLKYAQQENGTVVIFQQPEDRAARSPVYINGTVVDKNKQPLPGVTIKMKGTSLTWQSNAKGIFNAVLLDENAVLVFSFIGYTTREVSVNGLKSPAEIVLEEDISSLDEVQVTAYGTTTKRLNTGNSFSVSAEEIEKSPVPNVLSALQGRVPGLFITQNSGQPGYPYSVRIRGENTLASTNPGLSTGGSPLIIVDGVPYPGSLPLLQTNLNVQLRGGNALNYLNPDLIESVDVLKDADATSIYGSRGAYGVILITTKKGKAGAPRFNLNTYTGVTMPGTRPEVLKTEEYLMIRNEAFKNDNTKPAATDYDVNGTWPVDSYTDWYKEFMNESAVTTNSFASLSGGAPNLTYLVGANFMSQNNIQKGKGHYTGGGVNINLNASTPNQKVFLNVLGSYSSTANTMVPFDFSTGANITAAPNAPPMLLPDGSLNWKDYATNPVAALNLTYKNVTNNFTSNTELKFLPFKGLTLRGSFAYNIISGKELRAQPSTYFNPASTYITTSTLNTYNVSTWRLEPNANYNHKLGSQGTLSVTAGVTFENYRNYSQNTTGNNFVSDALLYNPTFAAQADVLTVYNQIPRRYLGYFGILNYNWANKYIINITGRYDGSSKFGVNNQFGTFGSVGAAYIISEEKWFQRFLPFISFAKIRGSYGTSGGDNISDYLALTTFTNGTNYQNQLGLTTATLANPYLEWEKDTKSEIGLALNFLKDRISIEASYYNNKVGNQLLPQPLSLVTGFSSLTVNRDARFRSYGYEVSLNTANVKTKNFSWRTGFQISIPKSKLISFPGIETAGTTALEIGKPITGTKVFNYAGVNPETGIYEFTNRDGVTGPYNTFGGATLDRVQDKTVFIDLAPKYWGGFNNTFHYKSFDVDIFVSYMNRMGLNFWGSQLLPPGFGTNNMSVKVLDRWKQPGDVTDVAKVSQTITSFLSFNNFKTSTGAYSKANFIRLSNLNISYSIPGNLSRKLRVSSMKIYLQGQNLLTLSKYGDLDPENLGLGAAPLRIFTGGLNLTL